MLLIQLQARDRRRVAALLGSLALIGPAAVLAASQSRPVRGSAPPSATTPASAYLKRYCGTCHGAQAAAGLNIIRLRPPAGASVELDNWEKIAHKIRTGEMPPKGAPRSSTAEAHTAAEQIERAVRTAESAAPVDPGRVTARRLNRAAYNNTVRDLLGVDIRPADDFPQDDSGYGFDNIGDALSLSPVLMERYLSAAEKVARAAVFGPEKLKPTLVEIRPSSRPVSPSFDIPADYDLTGLSLPNAGHLTHRFPVEAEYLIRVALGGSRPGGSEGLSFTLWVDGKEVETRLLDPLGQASFEPDRLEFSGKTVEFRIRLKAGEHTLAIGIPRFFEGLPAEMGGPKPSSRKPPERPQLKLPPTVSPQRAEEIRRRFAMRRAERIPGNEVRVSVVQIAGPYEARTGPTAESRTRLLVCGHPVGKHVSGCERKILNALVPRAYRRPAAREEVERPLRLFAEARKQGDSFDEGLCLAIQSLLTSPRFLFQIEHDRPVAGKETSAPITSYELASRLSYFLWSSMPDDALLRTATDGSLKKPEVLAAQVRRMLADPKATALVENFAGQWLEIRKLESVKPDRQRFTEFDDYLRASMRRETETYLQALIRDNGSLLELLDSDYSYLNERLARFYGVRGVRGPEFRRVSLAGSQRGGILTQASVLTVSSYATRTSPVLRGKWILENILNAPPPPPPPGVPSLEQVKLTGPASLRKQLEIHRTNPTCASCHARMDTLGFALENFSAIGSWRTEDAGLPIDTEASLPDGRKIRSAAELKAVLLTDRQAFARCVSEKMLTYALGRGLERYDRRTVETIATRTASQGYRFHSLVLEIVRSPAFQMRRGVR